ncbi:MAG: hypothetical protein WCI87_09485 [Euryarchaeota archaeon]
MKASLRKCTMTLHYDKTPYNTIAATIPMYGTTEFQSPTRSTLPLLSWLKHEQLMVSSLLRDIGMPADCNLHLEYKVKPPEGSGKASHSDLMVISGESSLAVEAKWTEPRYTTVGEWLEKGSNPHNRSDVLNGWLILLQKHAMHELRIEDFSGAVYQMVHRAASSCAAGKMPKLAYLVFKPSPDPKTADIQTIRSDLKYMWTLLGRPGEFPFYLIEVQLSPTAVFDAIASLPKGNESTAQQVSTALLGSDRLFSFEKYCMTRVGDKS